MNPIRSRKYRCTECGELHTFEDDAQSCCAPTVKEVETWKCSECGDETDDEDMARYCCLDEDVVLPPTPAELESAGQQRLSLYIHEEILLAVLPLLEKHEIGLLDLIGEMNHAAWELTPLSQAGVRNLRGELERKARDAG